MEDKQGVPSYEVFWPRSPRHQRGRSLAPRPGTLNGKVVGFLWDYLFRGDEVFELLKAGLQERFADIRFVDWEAFGNMHGSDERKVLAGLPGRLKEFRVDAVISAMAA